MTAFKEANNQSSEKLYLKKEIKSTLFMPVFDF